MDIIKAKEGLTVDERIDLINKATDDVKRGFFVIACEMHAIYTEIVKVDANGKVSRKSLSEFFTLIADRTGYKKSAVHQFLNSKKAYENLSSAIAEGNLPSNENVLRPLATASLNQFPEVQAELWNKAVESAGDSPVTDSIVKKVIAEHFGKMKEDRREALRAAGIVKRQSSLDERLEDDEAALLKSILRKMAMEMHPDHGGSDEKMDILIRLRKKLAVII